MSRVVPARDALQALDFILGYRSGYMMIERRRPGRRAVTWHRTNVPGSCGRLAEFVRHADEQWSDEITLGLPEKRPFHGGITHSTVLWVKVAGDDQIARAARFRPLPTVAIQEGSSSRRWLLWLLERPVDYFDLTRRNRRIAYALHAVQKHGAPDGARFPAPGSFLRLDRSRPQPVVCSRLTDASFDPDAISARLKDPPEPTWMDRRAA